MPKFKVVCKGISASNEELEENNRARSAKLRVIERIKD
jgi:16S rRNA C1402 N4-methylase RsmH